MTNDKCQISNEGLIKFLNGLKDKVNLFAPQIDQYGDMYLAQVKDIETVQLKHFKPLMPAVREVLFGQTQDLIAYKKKGNTVQIENIDESKDTIIVGLPTCDLEGILYNDIFYGSREFPDFYYNIKRKKLTLITMACVTPPNENCFCASMGHGPFAEAGFDWQLTDMGHETFMVETGSEKGEKLVSSNPDLFKKATTSDITVWQEIKDKARQLPLKSFIDKNKALENMRPETLNESVFKDIDNRCISCGACNYTCPTCECFNVIDLGNAEGGVRQRLLDSCILSGYWRMAGGHNPKAEAVQRTRNRYFCKLIWDKEKFGDSGCVGCGRCLDSCPVAIDIKEIMKSLS